jgi:hypothetical protein
LGWSHSINDLNEIKRLVYIDHPINFITMGIIREYEFSDTTEKVEKGIIIEVDTQVYRQKWMFGIPLFTKEGRYITKQIGNDCNTKIKRAGFKEYNQNAQDKKL